MVQRKSVKLLMVFSCDGPNPGLMCQPKPHKCALLLKNSKLFCARPIPVGITRQPRGQSTARLFLCQLPNPAKQQVDVKHLSTQHGFCVDASARDENFDTQLLRLWKKVWVASVVRIYIPGFQKPAGAVSSFKSNGVGRGLMARL